MSQTNSEWKLPKNIRQIGEGDASRKVYVEDYAFTFLNRPEPEGIARAILMGEVREMDLCPYIFVSGALKVDTFYMDDAVKEKMCAQMEQYFPDKQVVGWFIASEESPVSADGEVGEFLQKGVTGENQVLLVRDLLENETLAFVMEEEAPRQLPGYYIYYDKNKGMQDYLVAENQRTPVEKEAEVKDDAIRRFRRILREKHETRETQGKSVRTRKYPLGRLAYAAGGFLVMTVLALGVTMIYNYDKMRNVERSLAQLTSNVESQIQYVTDENGNTAEVMLHMDAAGSSDAAEQTESGFAQEDAPVQESLKATGAGGLSEQAADASGQTGTEGTTDVKVQSETENAADVKAQSGTENAAGDGAQAGMQGSAAKSGAVARSSYVVKVGDTLAGISEMYYGSLEKVEEICALNDIADENTILPGQKILLP